MMLKYLTCLLFSAATILAEPELEKKQDLGAYTSMMDSLSSSLTGLEAGLTSFLMPTNIPSIPPSIASVLETAVPSSFITALENPSAVSSFVSAVQAGSTPGWYQSLPPDVKSFLSTAYETAAVAATTAAEPTAASGTTATAGSSSTGSHGATSTGGAPVATGAFALGIAGAAGVLGLAVAL